jgi:16S rRNA (uracil1498-N3)-methyltransferase
MTLPVFWLPGLDARPGATVRLDGDEGRHAVVVRRIRVGEQVVLTDGEGTRATCAVVGTGKSDLTAEVQAVEVEDVAGPRLGVVQAIAKGERAELAVEVLTEVGVDEIVPWAAARSVAVWRGDRAAKSLARWRSTAREAAKQARRSRFPVVTDPAGTAEVVALLEAADVGLVLHEEAGATLASVVDGLDPAVGSVVLVVGPEGGIAPEELAAFTGVPGTTAVRLGPTVLRTSTAGVAAAAAVLARTPRWA